MLDVLGELGSELRWSSDPRLVLEVGFMRLARPHGELTVEALAERIEALELRLQDAPTPRAGAPESPRPAAAPAAAPTPAATATPAARAPESAASPPIAAPSVRQEAPATEVPPAVELEGGQLDRARVKRAWPSVIAEVKKQRAARASTFVSTDVDLDADGVTLVIEFPREEAFRMKIADEPETRELVRRALGVVLGTTPPFRFQLGRGAVKPAGPAALEEPTATGDGTDRAAAPEATREAAPEVAPVGSLEPESAEPVAEPAAESAPAAEAQPQAGDGAASDVERLLVEQLGAQIVGEQVHEAPEWKDEQ